MKRSRAGRHARRKTAASNRLGPAKEVRITRLGARGDGVAETPEGPLFIADTVPGDTVSACAGAKRGDGTVGHLQEIIEPGPDRVTPLCRHAAECGGCGLQHIHATALAGFKRQWLLQALGRCGVSEAQIGETRSIGPGTRRRVRLAAVRKKDRVILGFNRRAGRDIIDIAECPIARPELVGLLPPLRRVLHGLESFGRFGDIHLTLSDTGLDVLMIPTESADPGFAERDRLVAFAESQDIARVAWERDGLPEPIVVRRQPRVRLGELPVDLPMGGFLQPSREGEQKLVALALDAIASPGKRVADLYSGCGSFALPILAAGNQVYAAESSMAAVSALRRAAGGHALRAECRNLAKSPLSPAELNRFDAVLFDPPRAGAREQAAALAQSSVATVIAVSCNPATLARDLSELMAGGYHIASVTPIDQFTWSAHLEAVVVLHHRR